MGDEHPRAVERRELRHAARAAARCGCRRRARRAVRRAGGGGARSTSARASATRCCWPPESDGRLRAVAYSARPTRSSQSCGSPARGRRGDAAAAQPERHVLEHGEVREQEVVLEHDADAIGARARRSVPGRGRRARRRRSRSARRRAARARRARAATCVFPAPFGPRTATVSPSAAVTCDVEVERRRAASLHRARQASRRPPNQRSRSSTSTMIDTASSTRLSAIAVAWFGLEQDVDRERHGLRAALDVAGEGDGRAELAERPRPGERGAREQRRARSAAA